MRAAWGAVAAVTSEPAKAMYLDHKLGSLEVGLDADVVVRFLETCALFRHARWLALYRAAVVLIDSSIVGGWAASP